MKYLSIFFLVILLSAGLGITHIDTVGAVEVANTRGKDWHNIAYSDGTHVATFGLEEWVSTNTGYQPYVVTDGGTTWNIDMKQFPFKIDKTNCNVTILNNDKLISDSPSVLVDKEWWNIGWKPTTGGNWTEVDLSNTACTINTINNSTGLYLETTKTVGSGGGIGTLKVTYAKAIGEPFKTYQTFTNTDVTKTNHIFKFIEKYDGIHLDSISSQLGTITNNGNITIQFSQIDQSQIMRINKSGFNVFNIDFTKAYNNFQSVTLSKTGGLATASFDYGRNLNQLPVNSLQSLDPTFGYTVGTAREAYKTTATTGTSCPTADTNDNLGNAVRKYDSADAVNIACVGASPYWDISSIPDDSTITDTLLRYDIVAHLNPINCSFNEINNYPPTTSASTLFDDIINSGGGTNFVSNDSGCTTVANDKVLDLGTSADSDVTAQLSSNWWAVGITYHDLVRDSVDHDTSISNPELQITYTSGNYPTAAFIDGSESGSISTNCASRTTITTLNTTFPAASATYPTILIVPIEARSTDAGSETLDIRLYQGSTLVSQNQYTMEMGTSGQYTGGETLLYLDTTAAASQTYTVEACVSATAVVASADILAINGYTGTKFTDGGSTALGTGDTTLATAATSIPTGTNVVIAAIQVDNGGTGQDVVAAGLRIKNNAGTEIASNQYAISFGTAANTDIQSITLVAVDTSAPANSSYTITGKSANAANAEAKLLVFQPRWVNNGDSGSTAIAVTTTQLLSTTVSSDTVFDDSAYFSTVQVDDSDSGTETISASAIYACFNPSTCSGNYGFDTNDMLWQGYAASGSAGDGFRGNFVSRYLDTDSTWNHAVETTGASATGLNGEAKTTVWMIANPIVNVNCDACNTDQHQGVDAFIFAILYLFMI